LIARDGITSNGEGLCPFLSWGVVTPPPIYLVLSVKPSVPHTLGFFLCPKPINRDIKNIGG
jgi:hypothetical protein